jgi:hypothetical protein
MKKEKERPKDRHLDLPSEANRDKHINFVALENDEQDLADSPATGKLADRDRNDDPAHEKTRKSKHQ